MIDAEQCGGGIALTVIMPSCLTTFESAWLTAVPKYVAISFSLHCTLLSEDSYLSCTRSSAYVI